SERFARIFRFAADPERVSGGPVVLQPFQFRRQFLHDLGNGPALVVGKHRQRAITVVVGDRDCPFPLERLHQLQQRYAFPLRGVGPNESDLLKRSRAARLARAAGPFGADTNVNVVCCRSGGEGAQDIVADRGPDLRGEFAVGYAEEVGRFAIRLQRDLRVEGAQVIADVDDPGRAGQQRLHLERQALQHIHVAAGKLDLDRIARARPTYFPDHEQFRPGHVGGEIASKFRAKFVSQFVGGSRPVRTVDEHGGEADEIVCFRRLQTSSCRGGGERAFAPDQFDHAFEVRLLAQDFADIVGDALRLLQRYGGRQLYVNPQPLPVDGGEEYELRH